MPILAVSALADDFGGGANSTSTTGRDTAYSPSNIAVEMLVNAGLPMMLGTVTAAASGVLWVHFRFRSTAFLNNAASDGYMFSAEDSNGDRVVRLDVDNGRIAAQAEGDSTVTGTYFQLSDNDLFTMDLRIDVNGGNITFDVFINGCGRPVTTATAANVGAKTIPVDLTWDNFDMETNAGQFAFYNEFIVTDGEDTRGWRLATLEPDANGNYNQWTGDVTELGDLDPATLIQGVTNGDRQSWTPSIYNAQASATIRAVALRGRAVRAISGLSQVTQFLRIAATDYDGTPATPPAGGQLSLFEIWDVRPDNSLPWATADLATIEGGVTAST